MSIVIFDIDGTLCRTSGVDDACWCRAAREVLGVESMTTDWGAYPHSTDEAIACALIREYRRIEPTRALLDRLRDRFVELLRESHEADPGLFRETPGAAQVIPGLLSRGHPVAIATGGWERSARFKLACAGIPTADVPAAFADDAHPREEIISIAMRRLEEAGGHEQSRRGQAVYVGDGVWDLRAAERLGIGFLGIATGSRLQVLTEAGARDVLADFSDLPVFMDALERA